MQNLTQKWWTPEIQLGNAKKNNKQTNKQNKKIIIMIINNCTERRNSRLLTISSLRHKLSSSPGAIVYKSRTARERLSWATCRVTCHVYKGTAQLLSLTQFKLHLFELYFIGWTALFSMCVPQNQALGVCRGFVPDIQVPVCRTHRGANLVSASITSNDEEEEDNRIKQ